MASSGGVSVFVVGIGGGGGGPMRNG